jgi:hypothetical protein
MGAERWDEGQKDEGQKNTWTYSRVISTIWSVDGPGSRCQNSFKMSPSELRRKCPHPIRLNLCLTRVPVLARELTFCANPLLWRSALRAVERSGECGSTHREAEPSAGRGPIATATANFYRRARTRRSTMP